MKPYILAGCMSVFLNGCVSKTEVASYTVGEVTKWEQITYDNPSYYNHVTNFKLRLKYSSPLQAPFKIFADLRCLDKVGTLKIWGDQGVQIPFNAPPDSFFDIALSWRDFDSRLYNVCQIRLFDHDESRGKELTNQVKFFSRLCFIADEKDDTARRGRKLISFNPASAETCSFDK